MFRRPCRTLAWSLQPREKNFRLHSKTLLRDFCPLCPMFLMFRNVRGGFEDPIGVFSHSVLFLVVCRVALIRPDVGLDGLLQAVQIALVLRIASLLEGL